MGPATAAQENKKKQKGKQNKREGKSNYTSSSSRKRKEGTELRQPSNKDANLLFRWQQTRKQLISKAPIFQFLNNKQKQKGSNNILPPSVKQSATILYRLFVVISLGSNLSVNRKCTDRQTGLVLFSYCRRFPIDNDSPRPVYIKEGSEASIARRSTPWLIYIYVHLLAVKQCMRTKGKALTTKTKQAVVNSNGNAIIMC